MSIRIPIQDVLERAKERPPGYFEDVMLRGRVDGQEIELEEAAFKALARKYSDPSFLRKVASAADAGLNWALQGFPVVTNEQHATRMALCQACEFWEAGLVDRCTKCGCSSLKLWLATEQCPVGKWFAVGFQDA
jgi:hypothetical protein